MICHSPHSNYYLKYWILLGKQKKEKTKTHPNTKFLPIFNGRRNSLKTNPENKLKTNPVHPSIMSSAQIQDARAQPTASQTRARRAVDMLPPPGTTSHEV